MAEEAYLNEQYIFSARKQYFFIIVLTVNQECNNW